MTDVIYVPSKPEFLEALRAFEQNERRGAGYFTAIRHLASDWGEPVQMAAAISGLLRSWHRYFYHFGMFDEAELADCIERHLGQLASIRSRSLDTLCNADQGLISTLFWDFMIALRGGRNRAAWSPVGAAKALHLLAPGFLPLWDNAIASAYGWAVMWSHEYVPYCWQMKELAAKVAGYLDSPDDRSVLKRVDEFNYAVYTKGWVSVSV